MKIKVINEVGREVNPFAMSNVTPMAGMNNFESYHEYESAISDYPAPGIADGEWDAELKIQVWHHGWIDDDRGIDFLKIIYNTRQIFALTSTEMEIKI